MKTPVIKVSNLSEEELNILYDLCQHKGNIDSITQFCLIPSVEDFLLTNSDLDIVLDCEIECFSYNEFMKLYKECSLEHIL